MAVCAEKICFVGSFSCRISVIDGPLGCCSSYNLERINSRSSVVLMPSLSVKILYFMPDEFLFEKQTTFKSPTPNPKEILTKQGQTNFSQVFPSDVVQSKCACVRVHSAVN